VSVPFYPFISRGLERERGRAPATLAGALDLDGPAPEGSLVGAHEGQRLPAVRGGCGLPVALRACIALVHAG